MRLKSIPQIDPYQLTRQTLKVLKLKSSLGGQTSALVEKSNHIASASQGTLSATDFAITTTPHIAKKLNII